MKNCIFGIILAFIVGQNIFANEVPEFVIQPQAMSYDGIDFNVEFRQRTLMHTQFEIYTVMITVISDSNKIMNYDGYVSIWQGNTFVYSGALRAAKQETVPVTLGPSPETRSSVVFTFDINPQYISQSRFEYPVLKDDGAVETNCLVRLNDFISLPTASDSSQTDHRSELSGLDAGIEELIKKANEGDAQAQFELGKKYDPSEKGHIENDKAMAKWYRLAAEQGHAEAQLRLGSAFLEGTGVALDFSEAAKWFRRAAEQGLSDAQMTLGFMYSEGVGVKRDDTEAYQWNSRAAEQGNPVAQESLSRMYAQGTGVGVDYVEAYKWAILAGVQGEKTDDLKEWLRGRMAVEQIAEAQSRAGDFKAAASR